MIEDKKETGTGEWIPKEVQVTHEKPMMPYIVYTLYLLSMLTGGIAAVIGLVIAYVFKDHYNQSISQHYTYAIRTFWIGLLYILISYVLMVVLIGFFLMGVAVIWFIIRCCIGMYAYYKDRNLEPKTLNTWLL